MDNFSPGVKNSVFGGATNPSPGLDTSERIAPPPNTVSAFAVLYHVVRLLSCA